MKSKKILVIDTETYGAQGAQIAYDIGYAVCDKYGRVYYSRHYLVEEIFTNLRGMATAHYSNKFPSYLRDVYRQLIKPERFNIIMGEMSTVAKNYEVDTVAAYNLPFDLTAIDNTSLLMNGVPIGLDATFKTIDIWSAACEVLCKKNYIRACRKHGQVSEKGNVLTKAETVFRYISQEWDFEEAHRGLDDVLIECQILAAVFRQHKKFKGNISQPWRLVNKLAKTMK